MEFAAITNSEIFGYFIIPLLIFSARIVDVSLGTLRIIFVSRGMKYIAPIFGFMEVLIWLIALGQIMQNLTNPINYVAYAGGFAMGNFLGIYLADKLAMGTVCIRIITVEDATKLLAYFSSENIGYTVADAKGATGEVKLIFSIIKKKNLNKVIELIHSLNPKSFVSVEEIQSVEKGIFPRPKPIKKISIKKLFARPGK